MKRVQGSQLHVFESALALLSERAAITPVLVVLEDLHWADVSTLDLVVFLAHNVVDVRVVLVATCRSAEPWPAERVARLTDGVRRSGAALVVELAPLADADLRALLDAHTDGISASRGARRNRRPCCGQPVLRRGAARSRRGIGGSAAAWRAGPAVAPLRPARPVHSRRASAGRDGGR